MFGHHVYGRDRELTEAKDQTSGQHAYATQLLEELLNRAAALEEGSYWLAFERHSQAEEPKLDDGEYQFALENLMGAVGLFLHDCEEARVRARRARLVAKDTHCGRMVTCECGEDEASLAEVGGPLSSGLVP